MKKLLLYLVAGFFLLTITPASAQTSQQITLPNAGLTPESPFFFFDTFREGLQEFFTFNPEAKAHLQITFAAERIAEIKVIIETKGVNAKGLGVAQNLLREHLAKAAVIVESEKAKGKDVSVLAKSIGNDVGSEKEALKQTFKGQGKLLEVKEEELKAKIREARKAGNTAEIDTLTQQLSQIKVQKDVLDTKKDEQEKILEKEEERIEEQMEIKEKAQKAIAEAKIEKQEVLNESSEKNITLPANVLSNFDLLLAQAQSAFTAGNYEESKQLAKQAEKSLKKAEDAIGELGKAKEKEKELKEEAEEKQKELQEKLREVDKEKTTEIKEKAEGKQENFKEKQEKVKEVEKGRTEQIKEQAKEEQDKLKGAQENAKEQREKAEKKLREATEKD